MKTKQQGFTLIIVMAVLIILSLVVMATFEQAQWVKRSQYYAWLQVKMQDRLWQQLVLAEMQLPQRARTGKCFMPYSLGNDYFFMTNNPSPTEACIYTRGDEQMSLIYERLMTQPCAQIKGNMQIGVTLFRISIRGQSKASGQKMVLQAIEAMPIMDNKNTIQSETDTICTEYVLYEAGQQSWLLQ